ncbi:DUF5988 family protein [Lentzea jiangxiensis]|uniref:Uncharacterized protein n=1 Tax=Lentzea jiangxiensis TaxID=641025 RepID=A0A1H0X7W1_9PSEU|nr:DUF5988 family protein [Lentzea jiangxiensis]SDP99048.1 hypothetical protein SAMN05421507_1483 [Lentzea jiangxiensis]
MYRASTNEKSSNERPDLRPNAYLKITAEDLRLTRLPFTLRELYVENPDAPLGLQWKGGWERFEPTDEAHRSADGRTLRVMKFVRRKEIVE